MFGRLTAALFLRRLVRAVEALAEVQRAQTALLLRLADHYAPADPHTTRAEVVADTGVSHVDPDQVASAQAYIDRISRDTGHVPDEDEILIHLRDEATEDLHTRLTSRDEELARLRAAREW